MAGIIPFGSKDRDAHGQSLLKVVASVLNELVHSNQHEEVQHDPNNNAVTKFHGMRAPSISIPAYLERISKFSGCSNECFVLALIYIDRLIVRKQIVLDNRNVHRLVITSIMLAAKFFDDHYLDNAHYSAVGGVPPLEMNVLELEFLFLIEFNLHVTPADYQMYEAALANKARAQNPTIQRFNPPLGVPQQPAQQQQQQQQQPTNHIVGQPIKHPVMPPQQQQMPIFTPQPIYGNPQPVPMTAAAAAVGPPGTIGVQPQMVGAMPVYGGHQVKYYEQPSMIPPGPQQVKTGHRMGHHHQPAYNVGMYMNQQQQQPLPGQQISTPLDPAATSFQPPQNAPQQRRSSRDPVSSSAAPLAWA